MKYDLEERTVKFSKDVIRYCYNVKKNIVNQPIIGQLVRSATSIGANYCEANGASSKKDFKNKIHICKKEAQETRYWLRVINSDESIEALLKECQELVLIFGKIAASSK